MWGMLAGLISKAVPKWQIYLFIGGLLAGWGWWSYHEIGKAAKQEVEMEAVKQDRDNAWKAVDDYAAHVAKVSQELGNLQTRYEVARQSERDDTGALDEHDMVKLVKNKPGLVARLITDGDRSINRLFDVAESISKDSPAPEDGRTAGP